MAIKRNPAEGQIVAIKHLDNSDGERDIYTVFGTYKDGEWRDTDMQLLLEYDGDEILMWWSLDKESGFNPLIN